MDNKRALNTSPKLWIINFMVGEHSGGGEETLVRGFGASRKANVGISNDKTGEKPVHRKTKVS